MSYIDDEEVKMDDLEEEMDEDILDDLDLDDPVDDDLIATDEDDEDEPMEGFAGIDGAEY